MSKQNITIYVDENGIIGYLEENIVSENIIITINIRPEIKKIIEEKDTEIAFPI
jgi:hypothetical protein